MKQAKKKTAMPSLKKQATPSTAQRRATPTISGVWNRVVSNWQSLTTMYNYYNYLRNTVINQERRIAMLERKVAQLEKKKK